MTGRGSRSQVRQSRLDGGATRGFWFLRDVPVVVWLIAAVAAALTHAWLPAPRWLLIHLLLLGAVSHSIMVWSRHFSDALLHTPVRAGDRDRQSARLALLNGGAVLVIVSMLIGRWPVTAVGAAAIAGAALWHAASLLGQLRTALPARFAMTVRYYIAAASFLPLGALLGTLMARGTTDRTQERMMLAHVSLNVLGWLGLTVFGTLVTLWPTMLRTRIAAGAERAASRALPILLAGVAVTAVTALTGVILGTAFGLALYLLGFAVLAEPLARIAIAKPPSSFATRSVLAGLLWLTGTLTLLMVVLACSSTWAEVDGRLTDATPLLAAGFAAQVLLGAMSYLMPVALRGGPAAVRAATQVLDRYASLRLGLVNLGLLASAPALPSTVRAPAAYLVLAGFAPFVPLVALAARASHQARTAATPQAPREATGADQS